MIKVLVVDDQRSIRLTLSAILESHGCDVTEVEDGYRAIDAAAEVSFDLVLMDIKMPGINGVQTFREIKKTSPGTLVVMMTGYAVQDLVDTALEEGALSVIYKPFEMEAVFKLVDSISKSLKILVVDDNTLIRESLTEILATHGHEVVSAAQGDEALEKVRHGSFDLTLMDVNLPGSDGFSIFKQIQDISPETGVVFITGVELAGELKDTSEEVSYPVLYKPLDIQNLLTLVKRLSVETAK
jgi:DNA-binding NtrC family response regulator